MAGIGKIIAGAAMVAAGVALDVFAGGAGPLGNMLIVAGAGQILSGVGTMVQGDPLKGMATTTRNPVAPWRIIYHRARVGGTIVYMHTWGDDDQMLDMVVVLAAHPCQGVQDVLFDQQGIQIDEAAIPTSARAGYTVPAVAARSGTSFTPVQQKVVIAEIKREGSVVTVKLNANIPALQEGAQVEITDVPGDPTLNGIYQVQEIIAQHPGSPGDITFTYLCGGLAADVLNAGYVHTRFPDYGRNVYVEYLLGNQTVGQTFVGMAAGTPWQGDGKLCTPLSPQNAGGGQNGPGPNPWTNYCSLAGKTAAFIRIRYDKKYFPSGLPQISFLVHGKSDIFDPRDNTHKYTDNAALCIADHIANTTWGFKAAYGTEIPTADLIAAANHCDEAVTLAAGGTEPRYTCNGQFELTMRRGEILQNLLTSCAGRLVYLGGQFRIYPGVWYGDNPTPVNLTKMAAGPFRWRPTTTMRERYNGVKGTYISPENKWQSADFPAYAQDSLHGYSGPPELGGDILLEADGGERRWLELHLPFTISHAMAQRIGKIELLRRRNGGTGTFPLTLEGYQFAPLDIVNATVPFLGFANKQLEVAATRFAITRRDNAPVLGTEIDVQETDPGIYQWSVEEELSASGYQQSKYPTGHVQESVCYPWSPGYTHPFNGDSMYPAGGAGQASFGVQPVYGVDAAGRSTISLPIKGVPPINALDKEISNPQIACVASDTGGHLAAGDYVVGLSAFDSGSASHKDTDYLNLSVLNISSGTTGSITVNITWGTGDDGGELYVAKWDSRGYVFHWNQTVSTGAASATITDFDESTHGGPDSIFDHFGILPQQIIHGGVWAQQVQAVTATTITIGGDDMTTDMWAGYTLSLLAKWDSSVEVPILNVAIASNTASSGGLFTLTVGANSAGDMPPDLTTLLDIADLVMMRFNATFTADAFYDANIANPYYPGGATGVEAGHLAVVLTGPDAGDVQTIASVDGSVHPDTFHLAGPWAVQPNSGDIVVICGPALPQWSSLPFRSKNGSLSCTVAQPNVTNLAGQVWLIRVRTEDVSGAYGPDALTPFRELYIFGGQGTRSIAADTYQLITDGMILVDTTAGDVSITLLPLSTVTNMRLVIKKTSTDTNRVFIYPADGEAIDVEDLVLYNLNDFWEGKANG